MTLPEKRFQCGLVVGKFCPLHHGHELLIRHALAACEELIVISYTKPEFDGCDRATRERWLETLFPSAKVMVIDDASLHELCAQRNLPGREIPHNDAPDAIHREFTGWLCRHVLGQTVNAVFTSEDYGDGFADALSAYFRTHTGSATQVRHVCVDKARSAIPISGTRIRTDPHLYRAFLSPDVYASFVRRICFLGGESSGKTTLAQALAERCSTVWVAEYGRELWEQKNGALQLDDMLAIGREQVRRERTHATQAHRWLMCDTSPLTTLFYSLSMFGRAAPELEALAARRYDHVFLCAPDFPFVQDGTRKDAVFRQRQHEWYLDELVKRSMRFSILSGPLELRLEEFARRLEVDAPFQFRAESAW